MGQTFVDSLRGKIGNRSMGVYAVNYPASYDFLAAADGANDASAFIQDVVNTCPDTRLVLGGYSQGAAIIDIITSVPFPAIGFNNPLPPNVPDHVAALAVFGNPTAKVGLPLTSSPVMAARPSTCATPATRSVRTATCRRTAATGRTENSQPGRDVSPVCPGSPPKFFAAATGVCEY